MSFETPEPPADLTGRDLRDWWKAAAFAAADHGRRYWDSQRGGGGRPRIPVVAVSTPYAPIVPIPLDDIPGDSSAGWEVGAA